VAVLNSPCLNSIRHSSGDGVLSRDDDVDDDDAVGDGDDEPNSNSRLSYRSSSSLH